MKKIGLLFSVLPLLMCVVIFSVGFASWTASIPISGTSSIGITSNNVYYSTDYVNVSEIDIFDYTSFHFLDTSDEAAPVPSDVGYITVRCKIDIDACKSRIVERGKVWDGTLDLTVALFYSGVDGGVELFGERDDGGYYRSVSASVEGLTASDCTLTNMGTIVEAEATLVDLPNSGECCVDVKFALNIPENLKGTETALNFIDLFGKYFEKVDDTKSNIIFIASARIDDVE